MTANGQKTTGRRAEVELPDVEYDARRAAGTWVDVLDVPKLRRRRLDPPLWWPHRVHFQALLLVTGGSGHHMVDFEHYPIERGTLIQIAPRQVHQFEADATFEAFLLIYMPLKLEEQLPNVARWPTATQFPEKDFAHVESLMRLMLELGDDDVQASPDLRPKLLVPLLHIAQAAIHASHPDAIASRFPAFESFSQLVAEHLAERRDIGWYARRLGLSTRTLSRYCQQAVGLPAKPYLDGQVLLEAKRCLAHSELTVDQVGLQLGFSEATNFVKFFKRRAGVTPGAFRHELLGGTGLGGRRYAADQS